MTAFASTDTRVNLRADSAFTAQHPRFASAGPFHVLAEREVPGVYAGPMVHRTLIAAATNPAQQMWVGDDDLDGPATA